MTVLVFLSTKITLLFSYVIVQSTVSKNGLYCRCWTVFGIGWHLTCNWSAELRLRVFSSEQLSVLQAPLYLRTLWCYESVFFKIILTSLYLGLARLALYLVDWPTVLDTVGWVIRPVKIVPDMTYNVFGLTTLNDYGMRPRSYCRSTIQAYVLLLL